MPEDKLYKVEALQGSKVVSTMPSWGEDESQALDCMEKKFTDLNITFDAIRASLANNIYQASGIE